VRKLVPYTIALLLFIAAYPCAGQCPSNKAQLEIAASYGPVTSDQFTDQFSTSTTTGPSRNKSRTYASGTSFITVRYFMFNRLAIGFTGGIQSERGEYTNVFTPTIVSGTYETTTTTFALEFYYVYYFRKFIEVYTLFGFGPGLINTETTLIPAATTPVTTESANKLKVQYAPVGVRFGGRLGGFLELGIGYKGLVNAGLSYRLGRPCWWKQ
jgi:hypothetical protein